MNKDTNLAKISKIRRLCLENAKDLITAVKSSKLPNIKFHLAVLALEEIGKLVLATIGVTIRSFEKEDDLVPPTFDEHIKKLFWGIWGVSFNKDTVSAKEIESCRGLARKLHERRLIAVYVNPNSDKPPRDIISKKEADDIVKMVEARINLEENTKISKPSEKDSTAMEWFLTASQEENKKKLLFGKKSLDKLAEFNGNSKKWIRWLYEQFQRSDKDSKRLVLEEINRSKPNKKEEFEPKWRIKFKIYSASHSTRQQAFDDWNKYQSKLIKLTSTQKKVYSHRKDEIICELTLPKIIQAQNLWSAGWALSRKFVIALNIGSRGLFWWYLPKDVDKFYEEIEDLERNEKMGVSRTPKLAINWGNRVLTEIDLRNTADIFHYISLLEKQDKEALNHYAMGITLLSKNDIHMQLQQNAFIEFFECLKKLLALDSKWDGNEKNLIQSIKDTSGKMLTQTDGIDEIIKLALELQKNPAKNANKITLTEVIAMKNYCDLYFWQAARTMISEEQKKES